MLVIPSTTEAYNISCIPSVTGQKRSSNLHSDIIICKWEFNNGTDHYDTLITANSSCNRISYSNGLWSTGYISKFVYNDALMLEKYIVSSACFER